MSAPKKHRIRLIGRREYVNIPGLGISGIEAKIDTGAYTSSLHCEKLNVETEDGKEVLYFTIDPAEGSKVFRFEKFDRKKIKNSFGHLEERYVIKTIVNIGKKSILSIISLSNRDNMKYPLLIGRRLLKSKFLIDVSRTHTGGIGMKRLLKEIRNKI
jgi:hypothetical protein